MLCMGLLGNGRGLLIPDMGVEGRDQHQRVVQILSNALWDRLQAIDAMVMKGIDHIRQQGNRLEEVVDDHRLEHIKLEIALAGGKADGAVVAEDLAGDHGESLCLGRVDLARHDRAARLVGRNGEFAETAAGATGEPTHVVGDFHQVGCQPLDRAMGKDQLIVSGEPVKLVGQRVEHLAGLRR